MSYIVKQPNGLYMRFSTVTDCPTDWNMTREDYILLIIDRGHDRKFAEEEAEDVINNYIQPFERVIEDFRNTNMNKRDFNRVLKYCKEEVKD